MLAQRNGCTAVCVISVLNFIPHYATRSLSVWCGCLFRSFTYCHYSNYALMMIFIDLRALFSISNSTLSQKPLLIVFAIHVKKQTLRATGICIHCGIISNVASIAPIWILVLYGTKQEIRGTRSTLPKENAIDSVFNGLDELLQHKIELVSFSIAFYFLHLAWHY